MFFVQMSGFPGSGKSTLSRQIAKRTGAIIIDHDIVKSALIHSIEGNSIAPKNFGKISYNLDWSLIEFYLSLGQNVIFDSPCLYDEIVERGIGLSEKYLAKYKYVECYLDDYHEINARLKNRERMISQINAVSSETVFNKTLESSKKPTHYKYLVVDTAKPLESYIDKVVKYINE